MSAPPRVDPALLATFLAVADAGRISAAARALHLSQPAVTAQVQRLEHDAGVPLFVRSVRGVALTAAGARLLGYARQVRALLDEASAAVAPGREPSGALRLAASTTIAAHVLPPVLAAFRARQPHVSIQVEVGNTEQVVARLADGAAPLGLVEGHARAAHLRLLPFVQDEIVPVVGARATVRLRRLSDLSAVPMISREAGSGTRAVVERALRAAGLARVARPDDLELGSTEAIKGAVAEGLGVAFLSRWSIQTELRLGTLRVVPLADLVVRRAFRWALPAGGVVGAAERFYAFARTSPPRLPTPDARAGAVTARRA